MAKTDLTVGLTYTDGNIFALTSLVADELKRNGYREESKELKERLFECKSYDDALSLIEEFVNIG